MKPPPILALPQELLIKVLSHVVGDRPPGVCLWNHGKDGSQWCGPRRLPTERYTAMLLVCRAFYYAGIEAYYGGVVFKFLSTDHLRAAMSGLGEGRKCCIKRIVVNVEFVVNTTAHLDGNEEIVYKPQTPQDLLTDPLAELRSLRKVKVMVGVPFFSSTDTRKVMSEVEQSIRNGWSNKAHAIEIEWFWRDYSSRPGL